VLGQEAEATPVPIPEVVVAEPNPVALLLPPVAVPVSLMRSLIGLAEVALDDTE
jgi:hypothetical protein